MKSQWQFYKALELLSDVVEPQPIHSPLIASLDRWWRSLLSRRARSLDYEDQVEYLERRFTVVCDRSTTRTNIWQPLWRLLNQPLSFNPYLLARPEPEVRRTLDRTGQAWWTVYDPSTGQTAYLESEAEVQIWLEERLYH
ncbi:hypothetical protein [Stenomitos frigidus]|uniref:Uncharacterized protein n=1 Tax=Stenomitos frigidus ULC18 TaxID=2107698 RepID=A0A2T1DVK7_9CYAN|nr:hypothetical protein [Stenomitos frigidus]PSB24546.1 hypothetical protein C7B82_26325 [Stenomitos frigidus ULC18]